MAAAPAPCARHLPAPSPGIPGRIRGPAGLAEGVRPAGMRSSLRGGSPIRAHDASPQVSCRHRCPLIRRRLVPRPQSSADSPFPRDLLPGTFTAPGFSRGTGADKQTRGHKTRSKLIHLLGGPLPGVLMRSSLSNERF